MYSLFYAAELSGFMCDCDPHAKLRAKIRKIFDICKFICRNMPLYAEIDRDRKRMKESFEQSEIRIHTDVQFWSGSAK